MAVGAPEDNPGADKSDLVSTVFLAYPLRDTLEQWLVLAGELRENLPKALLVTIRLNPDSRDADQAVVEVCVDMVLNTFEEGVALLAPEAPQ